MVTVTRWFGAAFKSRQVIPEIGQEIPGFNKM